MSLICGICSAGLGSESYACRNHGFISVVCDVCGSQVSAGATSCELCAAARASVTPYPSQDDFVYVHPAELVVLEPPSSSASGLPSFPAPASGLPGFPAPRSPSPGPGAQLAHFELPPPVAGRYETHLHGAHSVVELGGDDAAILTDIQNGAVMLQALAVRMTHLGAMIPTTRKTIRECRELAAKLQEEVEERLGPLGARRW